MTGYALALTAAGEDATLWVPKTCATWADAQGMPSAQRSVPGGRRGGLRLGERAMIFGLQA